MARKRKVTFSRPEGAGNYDNMDDFNIVQTISLRQGTIQHTPTEDKDIVNKEYVDNHAGSGGATGSFIAASGETITVSNGLITFITSATYLLLLETGDKILMENGDNILNG